MRDPVCGMMVHTLDHVVDYKGIHFAFCSEQCKERFLANPHLYIGKPGGQPAPRQEGKEAIKKRRLHLAQPLTSNDIKTLTSELQAMMGIKQVHAHGDRVEIVYDLLQATAGQIETRLGDIGLQLGEGWAERLKRAFIHYEEECEVENLEVKEKYTSH
jgi:YHS domain-containing protein